MSKYTRTLLIQVKGCPVSRRVRRPVLRRSRSDHLRREVLGSQRDRHPPRHAPEVDPRWTSRYPPAQPGVDDAIVPPLVGQLFGRKTEALEIARVVAQIQIRVATAGGRPIALAFSGSVSRTTLCSGGARIFEGPRISRASAVCSGGVVRYGCAPAARAADSFNTFGPSAARTRRDSGTWAASSSSRYDTSEAYGLV